MIKGKPDIKTNIKYYFDKWYKLLDLSWWNINLVFCETEEEAEEKLSYSKLFDDIPAASCDSAWQYGEANLWFNIPYLTKENVSKERIEYVVLHELCHILVNEMGCKDKDHEERVVTYLARGYCRTQAVIDEQP